MPTITASKSVSENFNRLNTEFDKLIYFAGRNLLMKGGSNTFESIDDYRQNISCELWKLCNKYKAKPYSQLKKIFKHMLWTHNNYQFRKRKLKKNVGRQISLDNVDNQEEFIDILASKEHDGGAFTINHLRDEIIDRLDVNDLKRQFYVYIASVQGENHPQVKLYKVLAFGDEKFSKFCKRQQRTYCNQTNLANYFKTTTATIHNRLKQLQIAFNTFKLTMPKEVAI